MMIQINNHPLHTAFYQTKKFQIVFSVLISIIALFTAPQIQAQSQQKQKNTLGEIREGAKYYLAIYFDYKEGKAGEAFALIEKYFIPVDKAAGRRVIQFRPITGSWDEIAYFPLPRGPKVLSWEVSPSDVVWNAAFVKQAGSGKRVKEIWHKFHLLVSKTKKVLVSMPMVYD